MRFFVFFVANDLFKGNIFKLTVIFSLFHWEISTYQWDITVTVLFWIRVKEERYMPTVNGLHWIPCRSSCSEWGFMAASPPRGSFLSWLFNHLNTGQNKTLVNQTGKITTFLVYEKYFLLSWSSLMLLLQLASQKSEM